jgi:cytochrome c oxidase subunit 4
MPRKHSISPLTYTIVCALLILLTFLTVSVSFVDVPGVGHIVIGLTIGATKASLVVLFFMHALFGSRLTWIVIGTACFWLGILLVLTYSDYFTRGSLPGMPGY